MQQQDGKLDAKKFYESVGTVTQAQTRLDDVIDSSVRKVVSANSIREAVRNSNVINEIERKDVYQSDDGSDADFDSISTIGTASTSYAKILKGRNELSNEILNESTKITPQYGIELIDVIVRQIKYSNDLTESV